MDDQKGIDWTTRCHKVRYLKRHSVKQVAEYCYLSKTAVQEMESGDIHCLDFLEWVMLTSYYGKMMLEIPFCMHHLELPVIEIYSMHLRNGEPVQKSAKEATRLLRKEEC